MTNAKRIAVLRQFRFCFNPDHHRLPDYLVAVEALENLLTCPHEGNDCQNWNDARAALARLRDEVPA